MRAVILAQIDVGALPLIPVANQDRKRNEAIFYMFTRGSGVAVDDTVEFQPNQIIFHLAGHITNRMGEA